MKTVYIIFTNSESTPWKTYCTSITERYWLMLFREIMDIYSADRATYTNTLCGDNENCLVLK
jgi:hypothetical protein